MSKKQVIIAVIVIIIAGAAWYSQSTSKSSDSVSDEQTEEEQQQNISDIENQVDISDWKIYRNDELGLIFRMHNDWEVSKATKDQINFINQEIIDHNAKPSVVADVGLRIKYNKSLEEWINEQGECAENLERFNIGNNQAAQYNLGCGMTAPLIKIPVQINGNLVIGNSLVLDYSEELKRILSTFEFIE